MTITNIVLVSLITVVPFISWIPWKALKAQQHKHFNALKQCRKCNCTKKCTLCTTFLLISPLYIWKQAFIHANAYTLYALPWGGLLSDSSAAQGLDTKLCTHTILRTDLSRLSLTLRFTVSWLKEPNVLLFTQEPKKSGPWQGMKLAKVNFRQNPALERPVGAAKPLQRSLRTTALARLFSFWSHWILYDFESVQKVVGFKWKLGFDLGKKVWE